MSTLVKKQPNPWYVAVVSGMASYIDSCAIISFNVKFAFILLALFCVIGFASAILVFRKRRYNTFEEEEAAEVSEAK